MITTSFGTNSPPRWMESAASFLLPPAYRESVLGDLQERFEERVGTRSRFLGYVGDVATTAPQVLRSQIRRLVSCGSSYAVAGDLQSRAELLQTQIWIQNAVMLFSVLFVIGTFLLNARGEWRYSEWVSFAMTIGWSGAAWRSCAMRGPSTSIPTSLSNDELRVFHRGSLIRQSNLGYRVFLYWSAPALLLIFYGLAVGVPGFRGGVMLLGAVSMQSFLIAWVYRNERKRYQRELDRLDQEIGQP